MSSAFPFEKQTSTYHVARDHEGIVVLRAVDTSVLTEEAIEELVAAHIAATEGVARPLLVVVGDTRAMDAAARRRVTRPDVAAITTRAAIVVGNPVTVVLANFFIHVIRPPYATRMFHDEAAARQWLLAPPGE